ncbi:MAG: hypothetical protein HYS63_06670 [Methylocystis sp.]|nr:hypothetical protein [Methylocystis sp.]
MKEVVKRQGEEAQAYGTVSRVVAGKLVYVDVPSRHGTVAVTPEKIDVRQSDGSVKHYRGEPFSDLGIKVGAIVQNDVSGSRFIVEPSTSPDSAKMLIWAAAFVAFVVVALTWVPDWISPKGTNVPGMTRMLH